MTFVERLFDNKLDKILSSRLRKKYPRFDFQMQKMEEAGELIVLNKAGIVLAVYEMQDFDLNLKISKINLNWYKEFSNLVSENNLKKYYIQFMRCSFLDFRDEYNNHLINIGLNN